jgi:hypothetical protein
VIQIVGGKLDGCESPVALVSFEEKGETYILIEWKEVSEAAQTKHRVYMLAGMAPTEAVKRYRILNGFEKLQK